MKRFFLLTVALLTVWAAAAQMRFVDATELNLIGKALPTPHPYHRIDTVAYKGFTKGENQQVRCSAGLALVFKTNSTWSRSTPRSSTRGQAPRGSLRRVSTSTSARTASGFTPRRAPRRNAARPTR